MKKIGVNLLFRTRGCFGMGFFGAPKFPIPGMGIFYFVLDEGMPGDFESQKIPKVKSPKYPQSREWGVGIFKTEKSQKNLQVKYLKYPQSRRWGSGIFLSGNFRADIDGNF